MINSVFVYGTLKTGLCRETCWPSRPLEIQPAWTGGELYDTGPYPALFPGSDAVGGQLWSFSASDIDVVLAVLDVVEEYQPAMEATNLYNRRVIECMDTRGHTHLAYAYFYGREQDKRFFCRVQPTYSWADLRLAVWPAEGDW